MSDKLPAAIEEFCDGLYKPQECCDFTKAYMKVFLEHPDSPLRQLVEANRKYLKAINRPDPIKAMEAQLELERALKNFQEVGDEQK